jgi:mono/diheme cytochrome c family protein
MRRADLAAGVWAVAALFAALPLCAQPPAANVERGRRLYELHCGGCHYERVHERDRWRSNIRTKADLRAEVARWANQTRHAFTAEDLGDIVEYLDQSHYLLKN